MLFFRGVANLVWSGLGWEGVALRRDERARTPAHPIAAAHTLLACRFVPRNLLITSMYRATLATLATPETSTGATPN